MAKSVTLPPILQSIPMTHGEKPRPLYTVEDSTFVSLNIACYGMLAPLKVTLTDHREGTLPNR